MLLFLGMAIMNIQNGRVFIEKIEGIRLNGESFLVREVGGTEITISLSVILRCYAIAEYEALKKGVNWDEEMQRIMSATSKILP
jgi:hypothetical protein